MTAFDTLAVWEPIPVLVDRLRTDPIAVPAAYAAGALSLSDEREIATALGQVAKLLRAVAAEPNVDEHTQALLAEVRSHLRDRLQDAAVANQAVVDAATRRPVRERVLAALQEPQRPRDVAERLDLHPSNVARAIAELVESRQVNQVEVADGDDRAKYYQACADAAADQGPESVEGLVHDFSDAFRTAMHNPAIGAKKGLIDVVGRAMNMADLKVDGFTQIEPVSKVAVVTSSPPRTSGKKASRTGRMVPTKNAPAGRFTEKKASAGKFSGKKVEGSAKRRVSRTDP